MRAVIRIACVVLIVLSGLWVLPVPKVSAANLDTVADRVFGPPDFNSKIGGPTSATSVGFPVASAIDSHGNLYVADLVDSRVLEFDHPLTTDLVADRVFGQPDFTSSANNNGGLSAKSLFHPNSVALDSHDNLYVADTENHRVLEYDKPLTTDTIADRVFGQPSFYTNDKNHGGVSATSLSYPYGVAMDAHDHLYIADGGNNRVVIYADPLYNPSVGWVLGQPNFTSNAANNGGVSKTSLNLPFAVAVDNQGNLYIADSLNNRVLEYNQPLTTDLSADLVLGQPDFTSNAGNNGGVNRDTLTGPTGIAVDYQGNLYIADQGNHRILEFDTPLTSGALADRVFGQQTFYTNNFGTSATSLAYPFDVAVDDKGNVYIDDAGNNRVLEYDQPVPNKAPVVTAISPSTVAAGSQSLTVTVDGADFVSNSVVRWNGSDRATGYINSTQLVAVLGKADLTGIHVGSLTVFTPGPGGGTSTPISPTFYLRDGQDATADLVLGQPNFTSGSANNPLLIDASRLSGQIGVAVDRYSGRLFVADATNFRVLSWPSPAARANGQYADLVIGQQDFSYHYPNGGLPIPLANTLAYTSHIALDNQGNLYIADTLNNRVLIYLTPLKTGMNASIVLGQPNFSSNQADFGGIAAFSMAAPEGLALDVQGRLYVSDLGNNRVLEFDNPLTSTSGQADRVFGQPGFTSGVENNGGISARSLDHPQGLAVDGHGNLFVADAFNNRVLEYNTPATTDTVADRVFGQPDFTANTINNGGVNANSLNGPCDVTLDEAGNLYIADSGNARVLAYHAALTTDTTADRVFGQPDFTSNARNNGGVSASSMSLPLGVAVYNQSYLYVSDSLNSRVLEYDLNAAAINMPFSINLPMIASNSR